MKKSNFKKRIFSKKALVYLIATIFLLTLWKIIFTLIKWIAIIYLAYRVVKLALEGFSCPTCWIKVILALLVFILAFIMSSKVFIIFVIIFLWLDLLFGEGEKHKV